VGFKKIRKSLKRAKRGFLEVFRGTKAIPLKGPKKA